MTPVPDPHGRGPRHAAKEAITLDGGSDRDQRTRHRLRPEAAGEASEEGFSTAELLGNAALGIAALVAIWVVLEALGVSVVAWIGAQIGVSGG